MRLVCPSCAAQYEVPDDAIPEDGRDVQCGTCGTVWFQEHPATEQTGAAPPQPEPAPQEREHEPEPQPASPENHGAETRPDVSQLDELFEGDNEFSDEDFETPQEEPSGEPAAEAAAAPAGGPALHEAGPGGDRAERPAGPAGEAAPEPEKGHSADLDFTFDYDEDDAAPAAAEPAAAPEPVTPRFDKSLHSRPPAGPASRPSWVRETEPEDLSAPTEPEGPGEPAEPPAGDGDGDGDDLLKVVRDELDKLDEVQEEAPRPGITRRAKSVESAAAASGIVLDEEEEATETANVADLEQSLAPQDLEDLSAPVAASGSGNFSIGFATAVVLFALAYATYMLGPKLAATYPPAAPYLNSYTNAVNETRRLVEEFSANAFGFAEDKINEIGDGS